MQQEIEAAISYLRTVLPVMLASGNNWQITFNGGKGGDISFDQRMTGKVCDARSKVGNPEGRRVASEAGK